MWVYWLGFLSFFISPAGRHSSPRGSGPPGGPLEGTLTLHFIPIVISDDDDDGENEAADPTTTTPSRSTKKKLSTEKILPLKWPTTRQNKTKITRTTCRCPTTTRKRREHVNARERMYVYSREHISCVQHWISWTSRNVCTVDLKQNDTT